MKEKTKLRVIQILCIVSLLITVFSIQKTYARYYEKVDTTYATHIKKWLVIVNNKNIHEKSELSEVMEPIFVENDHMDSNALVPGREGYFEVSIDYTHVDMTFQFEFNLEQLNTEQLADFEMYGYEVIDNGVTVMNELEEINKMVQIIDPAIDVDGNGQKKRNMKIYFRWYDGEDNTLDNTEDIKFTGEATGTDEVLKYKATMKFTQYVAPVEEEPEVEAEQQEEQV